MPVYSYACKDCGHSFDQRQSFTDSALTACPRCEGTLRKLFNSVGVVFKGSGFYRTDSRSDGARSAGIKAPAKEASARSSDNSTATASAADVSTPGPPLSRTAVWVRH
jgi:putative FmdB family regulatory protein